MSKIFTWILLLAFILAACSPTSQPTTAGTVPTQATVAEKTEEPAATKEPIKIGLHAPMTGAIAFLGEGYQYGVTLALKDLNYEIEGHPVELIVADNKGNPTDAVNAVRKLTEVDQVQVMIGGGASSTTVAAMPIVLEAQVPTVCGSSTNPGLYKDMGVGGNPWMFRVNPDDMIMATAFAKFMAAEAKSFALVGENTDFGRGAVGSYKKLFEGLGVEVLSEDYYDQGTVDYLPGLTKIKSANPEAIFTVLMERDAAVFFRQLREVGLTQKLFSRGSTVSALFLEYIKDNPHVGDGVMEFSFFAGGVDPELDAHFLDVLGVPNTLHRNWAYYAMKYVIAPAIARVIQSGKEITRANIRDEIAKTDVEIPYGSIKFNDHNQNHPNGTVSTIEDGKLKFLKFVPLEPVDH